MADNISGERVNYIMSTAAAGLREEAQAHRERATWLDNEASRLQAQAEEQFSPERHVIETGIAASLGRDLDRSKAGAGETA